MDFLKDLRGRTKSNLDYEMQKELESVGAAIAGGYAKGLADEVTKKMLGDVDNLKKEVLGSLTVTALFDELRKRGLLVRGAKVEQSQYGVALFVDFDVDVSKPGLLGGLYQVMNGSYSELHATVDLPMTDPGFKISAISPKNKKGAL